MLKRIEIPDAEYLRSRFMVVNGTLCFRDSMLPSGHIIPQGYSRTTLLRRSIMDHRIVFKMSHGYLPICIDHIDGNRSNNSIRNLREATNSQNQWNMRIRDTELKFKGVYLDKRVGRYGARIKTGGKLKYLGMYATAQEAAYAYDKAAVSLFGEFAKTNKMLGAL